MTSYYERVADSVQIPRAEYQRLKKDSAYLHKLYAGGVDTWEDFKDYLEDDENSA